MLLPLPPLFSLPTYQSPTSGSFRGRILRHNSSRQAILEQTQYFLLTYAHLGLAETFRSVSEATAAPYRHSASWRHLPSRARVLPTKFTANAAAPSSQS